MHPPPPLKISRTPLPCRFTGWELYAFQEDGDRRVRGLQPLDLLQQVLELQILSPVDVHHGVGAHALLGDGVACGNAELLVKCEDDAEKEQEEEEKKAR